MIKAVFFDFWGTLVENGTYSPLRQSFGILHPKIHFSQFVERFERVLMTKEFKTQAEAFETVCKEFSTAPKPFITEKLIGIWNKNRLLASLYPDVEPVLKELKESGLKLYLVCNASQNSVEPVIEKFNLGRFFDDVFISYKEGALKNSGLFEIALEKTGLKNDEVIMVGDSIQSDIKGAKDAGIRAVLIDRKDTRDFENKITSLKDLKKFLEVKNE
ncbi:hypothetical protein DRJ22_04405 [Candidatus Woesearchaeota archaeon]|nr:MAG: hypothetical protein B6U93_02510 [Candidatus Woesearchaeota archaeon ex4484_78]RLE45418.1 MAG: hypothetical protein DRJ22_04405 [Candidatus Woesearchaeota archaeon]